MSDAEPSLSRRGPSVAAALLAASLALGVAGCGGRDAARDFADLPSPPASEFPSAGRRSLDQVVRSAHAHRSNLLVSPTGHVYTPGRNRFGFGVFTASLDQVTDAVVALYAAPVGGGKAAGPFPARLESLRVKPRFQSQTTRADPDAAKAVYVSDVNFAHGGSWYVIALFHEDGSYSASLTPTIKVEAATETPGVGDRPPRIHTPTVSTVNGDLSRIDTRSPHDDMHDVDFAEAVGKRPMVLLFATPALCQSRVCGPVVDVAEQVKHEMGRGVDFIHMEVFNHNNAGAGYRPQLRAFGLRSEPWLFVIDRKGIVRTRIEGAFDASELENAVRQVTR